MRSRDFFVSAGSQVKFTRCVLAAIISVLCVANAKASTVTYTESATVNGSLNGFSFASKLITETGTGDTTNISGSPFITNPLSTVTFSVAGVGSGAFTDAFEVINNQTTTIAGFEDFASSDLLDIMNPAFASYDLSTSTGPITGPGSVNPGIFFPTNAGLLNLTGLTTNVTFTANVSGVSAVPIPPALPLFASGLAGLGLLGWRRKKAAAG